LRKFPVYTRRKVTVVLKFNDRNNELYRAAIKPRCWNQPAAYRIDGWFPTGNVPRLREPAESSYAIFNPDWSSQVFLSGIVFGLSANSR
jgi:hypothetical protein